MDMKMSMSMPSMTATSSAPVSTATSMSGMTTTGMMTPYLHFTTGDNLLFKTWAPSSHGAIAGACIALVAIAIFERWISALRGLMAAHWRRRAFAFTTTRFSNDDSTPSTPRPEKNTNDIEEVNVNTLSSKYPGPVFTFQRPPRSIEPFILAHDLPRGVLYAVQALLAYVLMLSVMWVSFRVSPQGAQFPSIALMPAASHRTFQAAYIISIVLGLGIGEVLFGRMAGRDNHLLH